MRSRQRSPLSSTVESRSGRWSRVNTVWSRTSTGAPIESFVFADDDTEEGGLDMSDFEVAAHSPAD